ncbi:MAG TPA: hypothetical protein VKK79_03055, partial [Candidatus Lokiarchaeia archaeon]|nr:hypothetical protein [Candidatus Lokiarchaeia archaeon]
MELVKNSEAVDKGSDEKAALAGRENKPIKGEEHIGNKRTAGGKPKLLQVKTDKPKIELRDGQKNIEGNQSGAPTRGESAVGNGNFEFSAEQGEV